MSLRPINHLMVIDGEATDRRVVLAGGDDTFSNNITPLNFDLPFNSGFLILNPPIDLLFCVCLSKPYDYTHHYN